MRCLTTLSETLETLDISNNLISEWMDVEALVLCSQLSELYLSDNPVSEAKTHEDFTKALPNLKYIDDVSFFLHLRFFCKLFFTFLCFLLEKYRGNQGFTSFYDRVRY